MTVYVDKLRSWPGPAKNAQAARFFGNGKYSCHMTADTTTELIAHATKIGCNASWIDKDDLREPFWHFDLTPGMRAKAIKAGAISFDLLEESHPIMPDERVRCAALTEQGQCHNMAIRRCALDDTPICHAHSHPGEEDDGGKDYLCFDCAIK